MKRWRALISGFLFLVLLLSAAQAYEKFELEDGRWYTLYDESHNVLLRTGIRIQVGDQFLDKDNCLYRVYKVDEGRLRAWARVVEDDSSLALPVQGLEGADSGNIAIYHTHSGESYEPSDGVHSTDQRPGGVYSVGGQFKESLEAQDSVEVNHVQQTFFPYSGSYRRSRSAVLDMLDEDWDAIFDVHRDAAPVGEYYEEVDGTEVTQVMLVVGTQNPTYRVNDEFAWQLKATADEIYPDLVKGIFYAQGDYNQDLHPRALLLEVGAHTNSRLHAEAGISLFGEVVFATLYGIPENPPVTETEEEIEESPPLQSTANPPPAQRGGVLKGFLTLAGMLGLGAIFFLFISTGSWTGVKEKLAQFKSEEFRDVFSRIPWEKLHTRYMLAQFREIKLGSWEGMPDKVRRLWDRLRGRWRI